MEYLEGGTLLDKLIQANSYTEDIACGIVR